MSNIVLDDKKRAKVSTQKVYCVLDRVMSASSTLSPITLSAVCPAYNRAHTIGDTIDSFFRNAPSRWEMIVVDDGSSDNTREIVTHKAIGSIAARLRYVRFNSNRGAPAARNAGLLSAQGDYVMFIDSDDVCESAGIRDLESALSCGTADFAYGKVVLTNGRGKQLAPMGYVGTPWSGEASAVVDLNWHTMGALYRKEFILSTVGGWNESLRGSQDWELQARVKLTGRPGVFVDTIVGWWCRAGTDRIGAGGFKKQYVESVLAAVLAVEGAARAANRYDGKLRKKLSRRLINHAIEAKAHGAPQLCGEIGRQAARISGSCLLSLAIKALCKGCPEDIAHRILHTVRQRKRAKR